MASLDGSLFTYGSHGLVAFESPVQNDQEHKGYIVFIGGLGDGVLVWELQMSMKNCRDLHWKLRFVIKLTFSSLMVSLVGFMAVNYLTECAETMTPKGYAVVQALLRRYDWCMPLAVGDDGNSNTASHEPYWKSFFLPNDQFVWAVWHCVDRSRL